MSTKYIQIRKYIRKYDIALDAKMKNGLLRKTLPKKRVFLSFGGKVLKKPIAQTSIMNCLFEF